MASPSLQELGKPPVYSGWLEKLNAAGISVVTHDNQGTGRSEAARGLRFYVELFQNYVDDVLLLRKYGMRFRDGSEVPQCSLNSQSLWVSIPMSTVIIVTHIAGSL